MDSNSFGILLTFPQIGDDKAPILVTDLESARSDPLERGVDVGEMRHKTPIGAIQVLVPGFHFSSYFQEYNFRGYGVANHEAQYLCCIAGRCSA